MAGEERDLTNRDDSRPVRVKVDNVKKIYNTRNGEMVALNGVTLDIHDNEFICVVGPSGCGKSTLLNIIAGLLEPTSGAVYCDGKEVKGTGTDRGVVFQQYALFPWLTVKKNVMFALEMRGIKGKQAEEEAMKYLVQTHHAPFPIVSSAFKTLYLMSAVIVLPSFAHAVACFVLLAQTARPIFLSQP